MNEKNDIRLVKPDLPPLEKYLEYLKKIWESRWLTNDGEFVRTLERKLCEFLCVRNLVCVANGTLAIHLAIKALNLKDEIITTPFTFAATTNVILWEGLKPVFADIDPETFNIDPQDVLEKISEKTSAILAVHVFGNPCYVEELEKIAKDFGLKLIFDAAHAFGVEYKDNSVLNYGDISTLSFHATKVFHTIEGGALVSEDDEIVEKLKLLRNHGIKSEEEVILPGTNAKMNEFQAAMGLCNLEYITEKIKERKILYEHYKEQLKDVGIRFQKITASRYNYSYMPIVLKDKNQRDKIYQEFLKYGIKPRKYFYPLTTDFKYWKIKNLAQKYCLQTAKDISDRILCLPLYPDLEIEKVDEICKIVLSVIR